MSNQSTPTLAAHDASRQRKRKLIVLFGLAVVCGAVIAVWFCCFRNANNWDVVEPGKIYRSGQLSDRELRDKATQDKIAVIISLSADQGEGPKAEAERRLAQEMGIERWNLPLNGDGIGDPARYSEAMQIIFQANHDGKAVLVHCHSGAQRTGGVIAVYQALVEHKSPSDIYADMLRHGYDAKGNAALIPFLNEHMADWAHALVTMKVIDKMPEPVPRFTP
jgi:protein tyrosine phosphatase (PTP) superfamily phosphohydrolase (DUF442 family)